MSRNLIYYFFIIKVSYCKIFHLYNSDWKWTSPAEPALNLCVELKQRGYKKTFVYCKAMNDYTSPLYSESIVKSAKSLLTHFSVRYDNDQLLSEVRVILAKLKECVK